MIPGFFPHPPYRRCLKVFQTSVEFVLKNKDLQRWVLSHPLTDFRCMNVRKVEDSVDLITTFLSGSWELWILSDVSAKFRKNV